jgi:hypothetical protein
MTIDEIARVCHGANTEYCLAVGDAGLPTWDNLDESYKESTRMGVKFTQSSNAHPEDQHESWMRERIRQGWVYGPVLNREKKIHPNLVPYDQLPIKQQMKDKLFRSIVKCLSGE